MGMGMGELNAVWSLQKEVSAFWALVVSQERGKRARNQGGIKEM